MLLKLEEIADRFREVEGLLSDPKTLADQGRFRALSKEHSDLSGIVRAYHQLCKVREDAAGSQELLKDPDQEVREMARAELLVLLRIVGVERGEDILAAHCA